MAVRDLPGEACRQPLHRNFTPENENSTKTQKGDSARKQVGFTCASGPESLQKSPPKKTQKRLLNYTLCPIPYTLIPLVSVDGHFTPSNRHVPTFASRCSRRTLIARRQPTDMSICQEVAVRLCADRVQHCFLEYPPSWAHKLLTTRARDFGSFAELGIF